MGNIFNHFLSTAHRRRTRRALRVIARGVGRVPRSRRIQPRRRSIENPTLDLNYELCLVKLAKEKVKKLEILFGFGPDREFSFQSPTPRPRSRNRRVIDGEGDDEGDGEGGGGEGERDGERARVSFSEEDVLPNDADGGEETNKE